MWHRILHIINYIPNLYSYCSNPARFIVAPLLITVLLYLTYILRGGLLITALVAAGGYLTCRLVEESKSDRVYH